MLCVYGKLCARLTHATCNLHGQGDQDISSSRRSRLSLYMKDGKAMSNLTLSHPLTPIVREAVMLAPEISLTVQGVKMSGTAIQYALPSINGTKICQHAGRLRAGI